MSFKLSKEYLGFKGRREDIGKTTDKYICYEIHVLIFFYFILLNVLDSATMTWVPVSQRYKSIIEDKC